MATLNTLHIDVNHCETVRDLAEQTAELADALGNPGMGPGDQYYLVWQDAAGNIVGGGSRPINIILARVTDTQVGTNDLVFNCQFEADLYGTSGFPAGSGGSRDTPPTFLQAYNLQHRPYVYLEYVTLTSYDGANWLAEKRADNIIAVNPVQNVAAETEFFRFTVIGTVQGTAPAGGIGWAANINNKIYNSIDRLILEITETSYEGEQVWAIVEGPELAGGTAYKAGVDINAFDLADGIISVDEPCITGSGAKYSIVGFTEPINDLSSVPKQIGWEAHAPTQAEIDEGRWAIAKDLFNESQPSGYTMSAADTWVPVDVTSETHTRARPEVGNTDSLVSDTQGRRILWREGGTGLQWAIVRMLDVSATASLVGALAIIKGEADPSQDVDTDGTILDKDSGLLSGGKGFTPGVLAADPAPFDCATNPFCVTTHSAGALLVNPDGTPIVKDVSYCGNADGDFTLDIVDVLNPRSTKYIGYGEGIVVAGHLLEMETTDGGLIRVFVPPTQEIRTHDRFDPDNANIVIHNPDDVGDRVAEGWSGNDQVFGGTDNEGKWEDTGPCSTTP